MANQQNPKEQQQTGAKQGTDAVKNNQQPQRGTTGSGMDQKSGQGSSSRK